jgi:hypothetical protein
MKFFLLLTLLASPWALAQSEEPSLVELSKQARERKAKAEKPAKLITNDDLKKFQDAPVSMSKARPADVEEAEKKSVAGEESEAAKDKEIQAAKAKLQGAVLTYKSIVNSSLVLQLRMNNLTNAFYTEQDDATRGLYESQLEQTNQDIEKNRTDLVGAERDVEEARAEARAAGVTDEEINQIIGELPKPVTITDVGQIPEGAP